MEVAAGLSERLCAQMVTVTEMGAAVASDQGIHIEMTSPSEERRGRGGGGGGFLANYELRISIEEDSSKHSWHQSSSPLLPPASHPSVSITRLLPAFYHGALTPVLSPPLPHVHTSSLEFRLPLWSLPFSDHSSATFPSALLLVFFSFFFVYCLNYVL